MRSRPDLILLLIAAVGLTGVGLFVALRGMPGEPVAQPESASDTGEGRPDQQGEGHGEPIAPEATFSDAKLTFREDGEIVWRASFGGEVEVEPEGIARAEDVHWVFEGQGFDDLELRAPVMFAGWEERVLRFDRGVEITAEGGGLSFRADEVVYQFDTHKLIGTGQVRMRRGAFVLTGSKLVIDNNTQKIRVSDATLRREK